VPASRRFLTVLALAGLLPAGCGLVPVVAPRPALPKLEIQYVASSGEGRMNQLLGITNLGPRSYVPVLKLSAVDELGIKLPDVTVSTIYGSDRGGLVAPTHTVVFDVLRFTGAHADQVADVRATVLRASRVTYPEMKTELVVTPFDAAGDEVTRNDLFTRVRIGNDNDQPLTVRLVYIVWNDPPEGRTQQADHTEPIGDLVTVPAYGETDVSLAADDAAVIRKFSGTAPTSIKVYPSL